MAFDPATLAYNESGLIPVIAQAEDSGIVLMMAWMNEEAVRRTLASGKVTYWARSRQSFWVKGETSGTVQQLIDLRMDCDKDCLLAVVRQSGPACHTNRLSCFYTSITGDCETELMLSMS